MSYKRSEAARWGGFEISSEADAVASGDATTAQQLEDQHDQCEHEQQVNETRPDTADQAEQPEDEQDDDDRPEHRVPPFHRHTPSAVMAKRCTSRASRGGRASAKIRPAGRAR